MIVFSLDPGIKNIGIAILEFDVLHRTQKLIDTFTLIADSSNFEAKLSTVDGCLKDYLPKYRPEAFIYESPCFVGRGKNGAEIHEMLGVIKINFLNTGNTDIVGYPPKTVKKTITGDGDADKHKVEAYVRRYFKEGRYMLFDSDHSSDSVAVGLTYGIKNKLVEAQYD